MNTIQLASVQGITEAVRSFQSCKGNVVYVESTDDLMLLKSLWTTFKPNFGVTAIVGGSARLSTEGLFHSRAQLTRQGRGAKVEDVGLLNGLLSLGRGPWINPPTQISQTRIVKVERSTVRISVPAHYRRLWAPSLDDDSVKRVLQDLAVSSGIKAHHLTGGRWEWQQYHRNQSALIGWLRLPKQCATELCQTSGQRGIFVSEQTENASGTRHVWVPREVLNAQASKKESDETYCHRLLALAAERKPGLVWRKGGATDLGVIASDKDVSPIKPLVLEMAGVPEEWHAEEVSQLLQEAGWSSVTVLSRKRQKKRVIWLVRSQPPACQAAQRAWLLGF